MKLKLNSRRDQATVVLLIIIVMVIFLVVILGVAYMMVKAIKKIKRPPPDSSGWSHPPGLGSWYDGGVVAAYVGSPDPIPFNTNGDVILPSGFVVDTILIYAADVPNPPAWTNLVFSVPFEQLPTVLDENGLPMEQFPDGNKPPQRYYNIMASGHFTP